jgi:hypothetical protein
MGQEAEQHISFAAANGPENPILALHRDGRLLDSRRRLERPAQGLDGEPGPRDVDFWAVALGCCARWGTGG